MGSEGGTKERVHSNLDPFLVSRIGSHSIGWSLLRSVGRGGRRGERKPKNIVILNETRKGEKEIAKRNKYLAMRRLSWGQRCCVNAPDVDASDSVIQ